MKGQPQIKAPDQTEAEGDEEREIDTYIFYYPAQGKGVTTYRAAELISDGSFARRITGLDS